MRFLVDNSLSPKVASGLADAGHPATHVRAYGMSAAPDQLVLARARNERRVLVSGDTDFDLLLAASGAASPSVVLVRGGSGRRAGQIVRMILANVAAITDDLTFGAIVAFGDEVRVRCLPLPPA